jgi:chemotaxis protein methyltransferase CheR
MSPAVPIQNCSERDSHAKPVSHAASFELSASDFERIRAIVLQNTGISLNTSKIELVKRRFMPRLRALGLRDFGEYVAYLHENFDTEGVNFCNAITTNLTSFFRESHHFDLLRTTLRASLDRKERKHNRIRVWSAGCSAGQEAYSLAITLRECIPEIERLDVKILASDLDENCLATARRGVYPAKEFERMPEPLLNKYFTEQNATVKGQAVTSYAASAQLRSLITFNKLNLMHTWPMKGPFDFIFCRNVFIYFDKDTQLQILRKFAGLQTPGSFLCLGHSEIIPNPSALGYQMTGKTAYRKVA